MNDGDFRDAVNQFMGAIKEFRESTEKRLDSIDRHLEKGSEAFTAINTTIAVKTEQISNIEDRLGSLEKKDVLGGTSRTEKIIIAFSAIGNALKWVADIFF